MRKIWFLIILLGLFLVSCESDDSPLEITEIRPNVIEQSLELDFGTTEVLSTPNNEVAQWYFGNELITEGISYEFMADTAGDFVISSIYETEAQTDSLVYNIHVFGQFADGIIVVNGSSEDLSRSTLSFIKDDGTVMQNAFQQTNDTDLSDGMISAATRDDELFLISQTGPNYITQVNRETLELEQVVDNSEASSPSYLNFYNDNAVLVNADTEDRSAYFWNTSENNIYSAELNELNDVPAIQSFALQVGDALLLVNGNEVYRYENENATSFYSAEGFVSGVLSDGNSGFYIATQAIDTTPAKFVHYDSDFELIETIEVESTYRLPRNGNIIASGDNFYWQETSLGTLIQYNTEENTFTDLGYPFSYGIYFTTVIKENPFNGDIYIGGLADFTTSQGIVVQLSVDGELLNTFENIGYTPVDFIFNDKSLFR